MALDFPTPQSYFQSGENIISKSEVWHHAKKQAREKKKSGSIGADCAAAVYSERWLIQRALVNSVLTHRS